jgi:hypothetical protein
MPQIVAAFIPVEGRGPLATWWNVQQHFLNVRILPTPSASRTLFYSLSRNRSTLLCTPSSKPFSFFNVKHNKNLCHHDKVLASRTLFSLSTIGVLYSVLRVASIFDFSISNTMKPLSTRSTLHATTSTLQVLGRLQYT